MIGMAGIKAMDYRSVTEDWIGTRKEEEKGILPLYHGSSASPHNVSDASIVLSHILNTTCLAQ